MRKAIESAREGVLANEGGPFGACVVRATEIVSVGHNTVLRDRDPTCHAEINAIRAACRALGTHDLSSCELYTTAEPCPMCLSAIQWARIPKIHIGVDRSVAAKHGFDDAVFYEEIALPPEKRTIRSCRDVDAKACEEVFQEWARLKRPLY